MPKITKNTLKKPVKKSRYCRGKNRYGRRCHHRIEDPLLFCYSHHTVLAKNDCTKIIQSYLNRVDLTRGRDRKIPIVYKLLDFLVDQRHFVEKHKKFAETVQKKLREFYYGEGLSKMTEYHRKLFGVPILNK